jgi:uncharacterized membrane protein
MDTLAPALKRADKVSVPIAKSAANRDINISTTEQWLSLIGGGLLVLIGLGKKSLGGLAIAACGGSLLYRGATGHCDVYEKLGISTAHPAHPANRSIHIEKQVIVNKPLHEIYSFCHKLENLSCVMPQIEDVQAIGDKISHGVLKSRSGRQLEWAAEIINDVPDRVIAWQSLPGADLYTAGSISFRQLPEGTEVRVVMNYLPPFGKLGQALSQTFGRSPGEELEADLRRFKEILESPSAEKK